MNDGPPTASTPGIPVFSSCQQTYTIDDVLDSAAFRRDLEPRWRELLHGLACEAEADRRGATPNDELLQTLCDEFRYARELVTVEETENWLKQRDLSEDQLMAYLLRRYWLAELGEQVPRTDLPADRATRWQRTELRRFLLLCGEFDNLARRLAQRTAIHLSGGPRDEESGEPRETERQRFLLRHDLSPDGVATWLERLGRDDGWLEEQLAMEAAFRAHCADAVTPDKLQRVLNRLRLALISFDYEMLEVDGPDVLREARTGITVDGLAAAELARENGFPYRRAQTFLELLPEPLQQPFLSVPPGETVTLEGERHQLFRILTKKEPTLEDPAVDNHLRRRLLGDLLAGVESRHVEWILHPLSRS